MNQLAKFNIAQIIHRFLPILENQAAVSGQQRSILKFMSLCKTAALGGHKEQ